MAELADAIGSKSIAREGVWVRVPLRAPYACAVNFPLGLSAGVTAIIVLTACAIVIVVFIVIAPWRTVRDEPPIPEEAETRLLLGEDFDQVDQELGGAKPRTSPSVLELDHGEQPE